MHVAVIDIGKPGKNLGWAISGPRPIDGTDLDKCIDALAHSLKDGPVALGFEAPMWVPMRLDPSRLTAARNGECDNRISRPFSASAGATALVIGLVVVPYVLARLRKQVPEARATLVGSSRGADRSTPPSQIRTCSFPASGSSAGFLDQAI
jgi:hypothetical protein